MVFWCFHWWLYLFISSLFLQVLSFHRWFYYRFSSVFISPTFFTETVFCQVFCQVLRFCVVVSQVLWIWETFFNVTRFLRYTPSRYLTKSALIQASIIRIVPPWRSLQGIPLVFQNADPVHLFVWITQCSAKGISRKVLIMY